MTLTPIFCQQKPPYICRFYDLERDISLLNEQQNVFLFPEVLFIHRDVFVVGCSDFDLPAVSVHRKKHAPTHGQEVPAPDNRGCKH